MESIGIIGQGFVGTAVREGMKHAFRIVSFDIKTGIRDGNVELPEKTGIDEGFEYVLNNADGPIFVCLPTPMNSDGSCNLSIVEGAVEKLDELARYAGPRVVTIKSTVPPGTSQRLEENSYNHVCFNPEFLTERNYIEDFKNQDRIIIGGPREGTNVLKQMYETAYPHVPVTKTSSTIAELVKYNANCFLAVKVSFANEMRALCDTLGEDYDKVVEYSGKDKRLGMTHWAVPGPDGKYGFGGSCFPKDLNALMTLCDELKVPNNVMKGAWATNLAVRPEKDWEQLIGRAVSES